MLVKWGSIIVRGSGKLGGHVFSSGPSGASVHTSARARNPQSKYQMEVRSRFTQFTQGWRNLTESQRDTWYAAEESFSRTNRFGDVVTLSGKNLYESLNTNRAIIGLGTLDEAPMPTTLLVNEMTAAYFDLNFNALKIDGVYGAGQKYVLMATKELSQGAKYKSEEMRIIGTVTARLDGVNVNVFGDFYTLYSSKFGRPTTNSKIFVGTYFINVAGQKGNISRQMASY